VQQLQIDMYIEPKRRGSMQGSMQKTANYLKRAALQAHGTEFPPNCKVQDCGKKAKTAKYN
jgi:hypothetical protein